MRIFRTEIHGHLVEIRHGDFGSEEVLVNGRSISRKPFAGWVALTSHHFDLADAHGNTRHVETKVFAPSAGLGLSFRVRVMVDGVERAILMPEGKNSRSGLCANCGYPLSGLAPENGEVRCPECGRHTPAAFVGDSA